MSSYCLTASHCLAVTTLAEGQREATVVSREKAFMSQPNGFFVYLGFVFFKKLPVSDVSGP